MIEKETVQKDEVTSHEKSAFIRFLSDLIRVKDPFQGLSVCRLHRTACFIRQKEE